MSSEIDQLRTEVFAKIEQTKVSLLKSIRAVGEFNRSNNLILFQEKLSSSELSSVQNGSFGFGRERATTAIGDGLLDTVRMTYSGLIVGWGIISFETGSILLDIWKSTSDTFPPTIYNSICGSERPYLDGESIRESSAITSWVKEVAKGDLMSIYSLKESTMKNFLFWVDVLKSNP